MQIFKKLITFTFFSICNKKLALVQINITVVLPKVMNSKKGYCAAT